MAVEGELMQVPETVLFLTLRVPSRLPHLLDRFALEDGLMPLVDRFDLEVGLVPGDVPLLPPPCPVPPPPPVPPLRSRRGPHAAGRWVRSRGGFCPGRGAGNTRGRSPPERPPRPAGIRRDPSSRRLQR